MDYLSHPGRPSRALSGSQLSAGACCRWRERAQSWEMLISGAFCQRLAPAPLHYICHFCCSSKWTLNHPRTWEKYFTTLCCIFQIKDSWWTHNIYLKSTASLNVIIRSRPTNVCRLRASLNIIDSKNSLIIYINFRCTLPPPISRSGEWFGFFFFWDLKNKSHFLKKNTFSVWCIWKFDFKQALVSAELRLHTCTNFLLFLANTCKVYEVIFLIKILSTFHQSFQV